MDAELFLHPFLFFMGKGKAMKEKAYRFGYITKQEMTCYACCRMVPKDSVVLKYIEVKFDDGSRKFYYEDEEGFAHFERNFHSNRFMSYHEFFTTEEPAIEQRDTLKLKYFVRRGPECYEKVNLEEKALELEKMAVKRACDRFTEYGKYERNVDDHWTEQ